MFDPEQRRRTIEILSLLRPMAVIGGKLARRGEDGDGGYVILDDLTPDQPVYSLGVGPTCSFDLAFAERGHTVFMYDHTVDGPSQHHPNFRFFKQAIDTGAGSLANIIARNGHQDRTDLFMQMDIEYDEYVVIPATPQRVLAQFRQIVIELHWLPHIFRDDLYPKIVETLRTLRRTHNVIHVHANNYGYNQDVGGVAVPVTVEATLVRRGSCWLMPCLRSFPTKLDRPNNPDAPDILLGRIGIKPASKWSVPFRPWQVGGAARAAPERA
jgi:hypothetical protein